MGDMGRKVKRAARKALPYAFTLSIAAACLAVFVAELIRDNIGLGNFLGDVSADTLSAMGGLEVVPGRRPYAWASFFTSAFLHADAAHLTNNTVILLGAGMAFERMVGKGGFLVVAAVSLFASNAVSYAVHMGGDTVTVLVGASGLIYGFVGAGLVTCACNRERAEALGDVRYALYLASLWALTSLLLTGADSLASWLSGESDDIAMSAHVGGLLSGALAAVALPLRASAVPLSARLAAALALAGAFAAFFVFAG